MSTNSKALGAMLALLRSALWHSGLDLSLFPLTTEQWWKVYRESCRQTVEALVFQGIRFLPDQMLPPKDLLVRWVARVDQVERSNKSMNAALRSLLSYLKGFGLDPVLLKGQGVGTLYPDPLLRKCGDIDLYFPSKQEWLEARKAMHDTGATIMSLADGSAACCYRGATVELHRRLFTMQPLYKVPGLKRLEAQFGFVKHSITKEIADVLMPSTELNIIHLALHVRLHAAGFGIGLRQLCDVAVAATKYQSEVDCQKLWRVYRRLGIEKWMRLLGAFIYDNLGQELPILLCDKPKLDSSPLMEVVLSGGNFGFHYKNRADDSQGLKGDIRNALGIYRHNSKLFVKYMPMYSLSFFFGLCHRQLKKVIFR